MENRLLVAKRVGAGGGWEREGLGVWDWLLCVLCLVAQLCLTLCNPVGCNPPGPSVHGGSPGKNIGVGFHALLQGIFPTQGLNPSLCMGGRFFTTSATGKPMILNVPAQKLHFM